MNYALRGQPKAAPTNAPPGGKAKGKGKAKAKQ